MFERLIFNSFSNTLMRIFFANSSQMITYSLTYIVLSKILHTFPSKAHTLFLSEARFEKFDSRTIQVNPYCPLSKIAQKHTVVYCIFSIFLVNSHQDIILFDS